MYPADLIYNRVSFASYGFQKFTSKQTGDGGLSLGKLVFTEEMEKFSGKHYPEILNEIVGTHLPDKMNVGGPSLVSMIHTAQMPEGENVEVKFFGMGGNNEYTEQIFKMIRQTPLKIGNAGGIITFTGYAAKYTERGTFNLTDAISWGISSGGFGCFTVGGTYLEPFPGGKKQRIQDIQDDYKKQLINNQ